MPHTIAENLTRLQNARALIAKAITAKGGTVSSGDGYEDFVKDILTIPTTESWALFRDIVRLGCAPDLFPVGTVLYDTWGDNTTTAFQVLGYDVYFDPALTALGYTHSAILAEVALTDESVMFDREEAWLYVETEIPAGTYRFKIPNYDTSYGGNKWYYFTTAQAVPIGGQITLSWAYNQNPASVATYTSATSTAAIESKSITEWIEGTSPDAGSLGVIKLSPSDAESDYGKLNHIHRVRYGSNNYYQSGIRQYINADVSSGWWQPQTVFDRPVSNYSSAGKLTKLNADFISVLATPTIPNVANNVFEYPSLDGTTFTLNQEYSISTDKLFLLSHTEIGLSSAPNTGTLLAYYNGKGNSDRIKYRKSNGNAQYWWLRAPYPSLANRARDVSPSGALSNSYAYINGGVSAACIIQ